MHSSGRHVVAYITDIFVLAKLSKTGRIRNYILNICIIVGAFGLLVGIKDGVIWRCDDVHPVGLYHSPDSTHTLVVLEGDASAHIYGKGDEIYPFYCAYRAELDLVYYSTHFPYVGQRNQRTRDIQIHWMEDASAQVYFIYDPAKGPVEEDSILVSFK